MNAPSIIILAVIAIVFFAIVGKGIYNCRHHKGGGCGGGCAGCPSCGLCHPNPQDPPQRTK